MAIPPFGGRPPEPVLDDLVTGNSSEFTTNVGNWTSSGGTLTRDTTAGYRLGTLLASLKWVTTAQNQYITVPISGTFRVGVEYVAIAYLEFEPDTATGHSMSLSFGLVGTDVGNQQWSGTNDVLVGRGPIPFAVRWVPTDNRTGVTFRVTRAGTETGTVTYRLSWFKAFRVRPKGTMPLLRPPVANNGQNSKHFLATQTMTATLATGPSSGALDIVPNGAAIKSSDNASYVGTYGSSLGSVTFLNAEHPPGDLSDSGVDFEAGTDYVGMFISERDADTVQLYADATAGFMMQLRHRGSGKGWSVSDDGSVNARLESFFQWERTVAGVLTTGTDLAAHFQAPQKARIDEVRVHVGTAPTGSALIVDVNDDGTTIFTTQGNRPMVAISATDATSGAPDGGLAVDKDSVISVDIDQVGSTIAGSDLTVFIRGRYIW